MNSKLINNIIKSPRNNKLEANRRINNVFSYSHIAKSDISTEDIKKLNVGNCLNDNLINYYL